MGIQLNLYVNPEFVNDLKADPPTKLIKLQMMQEIATQYGIMWNSKSLETKLYTPLVVQDWSEYGAGTKNESPKPRHQNVYEAKIQETEMKHNNKQTEVTKKERTPNKELPYKPKAETEKKEEKQKDLNVGNGLLYTPRAEVETKKDGGRSPYWSSNASSSSSCDTLTSPEYSPEYRKGPDDSPSEDIIPKGRNFYAYESTRKSTSSDTTSIDTPKERNLFAYESTRKSISSVTASTSGREENTAGFRSMPPPPYIKTESTKKSTTSDATSEDLTEGRKLYGFRSMAPPYIKTDLTKKVPAATIPNEREEGSKNISKPVPRSMRNRRPFQPVAAGSSRANNEVPKPSTKSLYGENRDCAVDEEEMKMDKLLSHYSKKPTHIPSASTRFSFKSTSASKGLPRATTYLTQLAAFRARS